MWLLSNTTSYVIQANEYQIKTSSIQNTHRSLELYAKEHRQLNTYPKMQTRQCTDSQITKRKYPYQEFRGFRAWTSAASSSQLQSATDNNWSLGSPFGTTRQLAWVRKVVDFRFKRWLDKSLETYRVVLFNWFHPKSWSGGDDKIPTKKGKLEVYL